MGGKSKAQFIGYWYGATMHCGIGLAMDELYKIEVGGKTAWTGSIKKNGTFGIAQPWLFGGIKAEGGIWGSLQVLFGLKDQQRSSYLTRLLGKNIPAYRGTATVVFDGWMCALNPYPKEWAFCYRRLTSGWPDDTPWYPEKISIWLANNKIQAMNPAHMLYESFISDTWGSGEPRSKMDDAAFRKAADTLYNEQFGLCIEWKTSDEIKKFRDLVCDHIGAKCSTDNTTGLITIRLIRDDYKIEDLSTFDEDTGLLDLQFDSTNNTEVPSQVIIKYTDAITFQECSIAAVNPAVAQGQFGRNTETTEYPAIPTGELATRVAFRDLKAKTTALKRCTVKLDRRGYELVNGQPFRIKTKYRINNLDIVVRGERREEKFLTDGTITITALQDVFSLPKVAFNPTPENPGQWQPDPPAAVNNAVLIESPYRELSAVIDPANLKLLDDTDSFFFAIAREPNSSCRSFNMISRVKGASVFNDLDTTFSWCPTATITSPIGYTDEVIHIAEGYLIEQVVAGTAALIDNEIVRIDEVDLINSQIVIGRGCIDTVPVNHNIGATIWFYDTFEAVDETLYSAGLTVEAKLLSSTANAILPESQAPLEALTFVGRQALPYAPGNFKINGTPYPDSTNSSQISVSWSHRNRLIQADQLIDTRVGDISTEPGTSYNLNIYNGGALIKKVTGITTTNYVFNTSELGDTSPKDKSLLQFDDFSDPAGNNWTTHGNPQIISDSGAIGGSCLSLDGSSYLSTDNSSVMNFGKGEFTIECWIKPKPNTGKPFCVIISSQLLENSPDKFFNIAVIGDNSGQKIYAQHYNGYDNRVVFLNDSYLNFYDNQWHHVAFVREDNKEPTFYIDGQKMNATVANGSWIGLDITSVSEVFLGRRNDIANNYLFEGLLDQLRITPKALYTTNFTPSKEPYNYSDGESVTCRITLNSERDGLTSYQTHDISFKVE